jgi:transposase
MADAAAGESSGRPAGTMVIELADGRRIEVDRWVDGEALRRVIAVLEGLR